MTLAWLHWHAAGLGARFVAATEHALAELLAVDRSELDLMALLVDSVKVAGHAAGRARHHHRRQQSPHAAGGP